MPQIVETKMSQPCFGNDIVKTTCLILRRDQLAIIITADEALKFLIIGRIADLFEVLSALLQTYPHLTPPFSHKSQTTLLRQNNPLHNNGHVKPAFDIAIIYIAL